MTHKSSSALRSARQWRGLTIRQLRDASGVCTGRLSMLERGMVRPSMLEQLRLAAVLEQTVETLFPDRSPRPADAAPDGPGAAGADQPRLVVA
jgi:transcriptional regulator with XRE-family HTH domain